MAILAIYGQRGFLVGFFYQFTCRVERTEGLKDKTEFWDRLLGMERDKPIVINFLPFKINGYGPLPYIICWGKLKRWKVWNGKFALTHCQESASDFLGMIPPRPLPLPVTYPCNLTKSLWSHRPRKKKWKKLDGKRLIFHLTQYLQQNWWYHKEMIVCINRNKIQKCRTGNLETGKAC